MKINTFRGNTKQLLVLSFVLSLILISFSVYAVCSLVSEQMPIGVVVFLFVLCLLIFIFGLYWLLSSLYDYYTKIEIYENKLLIKYPFKKEKRIDVSQLTFWGCVAYVPRGSMLFFCTADRNTVLNYLKSHWKLCERIYGEKKTAALKQTDDGILHLAIGTYLYPCMYKHQQDVFILRYASVKQLRSAVNAMKRDAMLTGPWLLDTRAGWEQYSRFCSKK